MTVDPSEGLVPDQSKYADLKARLRSLPLAERVALELRLAKELGIVITPDQLLAIATPTTSYTRIDDPGPPDRRPSVPAPSPSEWGGVDMEARASMSVTLRAMGLGNELDVGGVREAIRRLDQAPSGGYGGQDTAALVAGLHDRLELLAARGEHPELVAQGRASFAKAVFGAAAADPNKPGPGGGPNR